MKILSKAEREAEAKKRAYEASKKAKKPQQSVNVIDKIKEQLQKLGYQIVDESALSELATKDGKLQFNQISLLSDRGAISLNVDELDKPSPVASKEAPAVTKPKIFSVSEFVAEAPVVQRQTATDTIVKSTEQRIEDIKKRHEQKLEKTQSSTQQKKIEEKEHKTDEKAGESEWIKNYPEALQKWCDKNVDKKTGQPKRKVTGVRSSSDDKNHPVVDVEIAPLSPVARKRGDNGAIYSVKKSPQPDKIDVTLKSTEAGKPLDYDYFYALVKAAHDSGADTIEFNNIRTPEFRDKLLAAALQFKMKLKNPPGVINLEAAHLQSIPAGCRQYLEKHNEAVKKVMQERRKEIVPEKGLKYGTGPRAEDRTHAEKEFIESERIMEKLQKAEKRRQEWENKGNLSEEERQYFEQGNRNTARRDGSKSKRHGQNGQPFRQVKSRQATR